MPLVRIRYKPFMHDTLGSLSMLAQSMCEDIAAALSCDDPGAQLTAGEIELYLDPAKPGDHNTPDLAIDIEACYYPARQANHQERSDLIRSMMLRYYYPVDKPPTVGVWLKLVNAAWSGDD